MAADRVDGNGVPIIAGVNAKIGTLERRMQHLQRRLDADDYRSSNAAEFDRTEVEALRAAIRALRFHAARLAPETDPVVALQRLVAVTQEYLARRVTQRALAEIVERSQRVVAEAA